MLILPKSPGGKRGPDKGGGEENEQRREKTSLEEAEGNKDRGRSAFQHGRTGGGVFGGKTTIYSGYEEKID